jgi:exonuclease V gamma subunit
MTEEERWQRHLWRVLFAGDNGYLLLSDLMEEAVAAAELYAGTESRLVLVGSSFIGETALKFFQKVSASADVCHIFITPLGHSSEDNAFCKNYGRIAYDFEKFAATVPSDNIRVYEQPYPSSFLGRLQQKVYRGGGELPPPDDSVLIYACGSKMREIETVKNVLLRLLDSDSSLKPQDIALIAPDINDYEPYIDAVFKRGEDNERRGVLPYNVVDLKQQEAYTEAFLSLLALAGSEFSRRELFALFNNNFFAQANHISDEDKKIWLGFCRQTEIIRAVDSGHKNRLGEEQKPYNTWRYAFEHFMTAIVLGESEIFEFNADDQGVGESIGRLIDLIRRLYNDFYLLDQREYSFAEWIKKLELLMRRYLSINDDENNWALKQVFRNMQETLITVGNFKVLKQQGVLSEDRLSFAVIKSYLSEVSALSERRKGAFLSGGVVCSSLTPMRSIPFRVIVFLGLAGEHFPGGDGHERSFDLSQSLPSGIKAPLFNLSRRTADRFAFLETLMAARERLIFTFQGRELISGATAEPSQALIDLIDYAGFTVSESSPSINRYPFVYHQPLHAFSRENFNKKLPSATYNVAMQQLARRYYMTERQNSFYKVIGHGAPVSVTAGKLAEVLYNPSFYFFKDILQGGMPAEALDEDCEEESFELTYPIKKMLLCRLEALFYSGTGIDVETFFTETFTLLEKKGVIPSSFYAEPVKDELYLLIKEYAAALNFLTAGVFTGGSFCECKAESLDFTLTEAPVNLTAPQLCF